MVVWVDSEDHAEVQKKGGVFSFQKKKVKGMIS